MGSFGGKFYACLLVIVTALASLNVSQAQSYPNRPLRLVVGTVAGGGIDTISRTVATPLSEALGQPIVIENRPGAGMVVATKLVATASADGYTLLMGTIATHGINPVLKRDLGYDPIRDFAPITLVANAANVLVVPVSLPARTVGEFVAYAKANPGKLLFGSPGVGSSIHLSMELFKQYTKTEMAHVPYKTSLQPALLSGEIQAACANIPASLPNIRAGRLRALAVTSKSRSSRLPNVPSFTEEGVPLEVLVWYAIFSPAGVPKPVVEKLSAKIHEVLQLPDVVRRLDLQGYDVKLSTPEELAAWVRSETERWREVVKVSGISVH